MSEPTVQASAEGTVVARGRSYPFEWGVYLREWRHNHCMMCPLSACLVVVVGVLWVVLMVVQIPQFVIGLLMAPLLKRCNWLVEFVYPTRIVGWGHITLVKWAQSGRRKASAQNQKRGNDSTAHYSKALRQRVEVVKGRVYIHSIPILMDNVAYLVLHIPQDQSGQEDAPIDGLVVDCGDADDVAHTVERIRKLHYSGRELRLHAILSTHKHHDHTAGNRKLVRKYFPDIAHVYGGAVERVPFCSDLVANADRVPLPSGMADVAEIEVIAAPSHTRGSVIYALRNKPLHVDQVVTSYLFTGDAMFCGGGGVPFEADRAENTIKKINPSAGVNSMERCFAEVLARVGAARNAFIFPGHEYTADLLQRQFDPRGEFGKLWNLVPPSSFFETASYFLVSHHRRTLPRESRMPTIPSPIERELRINPHFRTIRRRGEVVLHAIEYWKKRADIRDDPAIALAGNSQEVTTDGLKIVVRDSNALPGFSEQPNSHNSALKKSRSSTRSWNLTTDDIKRDVFATVYEADLQAVIEDLKSGRVDGATAAGRLSQMRARLDEPVLYRRPAPGSAPSDKMMHSGLLGLAILGSPPVAMTPSDSDKMNLPMPTAKSDRILISKLRLQNVLVQLGLIPDTHCQVARDIDILWVHATRGELFLSGPSSRTNYSSVDQSSLFSLETENAIPDEVELGLLKLALYGASPPSFWSRFCQPCKKNKNVAQTAAKSGSGDGKTPANSTDGKTNPRKVGGEVVYHECSSCLMCKNVVGCPLASERRATTTSNEKKPETALMAKDEAPAAIPVSDSVEMEVVSFNSRAVGQRQ